MMRVAGLLASLVFASAVQAQTPLDSYLEHLKTLRAEFSQVVTDSKGREVQSAQGKLIIVRPGRFRWELTPSVGTSSSPQLMVADGKNLWFYDRDLEQVSVKPASSALTATPAGLLSGEGNIRELFTVAPAGRKDGLDWVLVTPKENDADFREARLAFGKSRQAQTHGAQGQAWADRAPRFRDQRAQPTGRRSGSEVHPAGGADVIGTPVK